MWWHGNSGGYYATSQLFRYKIYRQVSVDDHTTWRASRSLLDPCFQGLWRDLPGYTPPPPEPRATDRRTLPEAKARVEAIDRAEEAS